MTFRTTSVWAICALCPALVVDVPAAQANQGVDFQIRDMVRQAEALRFDITAKGAGDAKPKTVAIPKPAKKSKSRSRSRASSKPSSGGSSATGVALDEITPAAFGKAELGGAQKLVAELEPIVVAVETFVEGVTADELVYLKKLGKWYKKALWYRWLVNDLKAAIARTEAGEPPLVEFADYKMGSPELKAANENRRLFIAAVKKRAGLGHISQIYGYARMATDPTAGGGNALNVGEVEKLQFVLGGVHAMCTGEWKDKLPLSRRGSQDHPQLWCLAAAARDRLAAQMVNNHIRDLAAEPAKSARKLTQTLVEKEGWGGLPKWGKDGKGMMTADLEGFKAFILEKKQDMIAAVGAEVPADVWSRLDAEMAKYWEERDRLAAKSTFDYKFHDKTSEKVLKDAIKKWHPKVKIKRVATLKADYSISVNAFGVPTHRTKVVSAEYQLPGEKWCRQFRARHRQDHKTKWVTPGYLKEILYMTRYLPCGK